MKILMPFRGGSVGGAHLSAGLLATGLRDRGHEVVAVKHGSMTEEDNTLSRVIPQLVDDESLPTGNPAGSVTSIRDGMRYRKQLAEYLSENSFDIVHTHELRMHILWTAPAQLVKTPHVWHQRNSVSGLAKVAIRQPAHVIAVSAYVKESIPLCYRRADRVSVLWNPVTIPQAPASPIGPRNTARGVGLAFIGRPTDPRKRVIDLLTAAKLLQRRLQENVTIRIIGPYASALRSARRAAKSSGVEIQTYDFLKDPFEVVRPDDIVIAPAQDEGFGRILPEAALRGFDVVASRSGGHVELAEALPTIRLFDLGDARDLVRQIEHVLRPIIGHAPKPAHDLAWHFDVNRHAWNVEDIYSRLVDRV